MASQQACDTESARTTDKKIDDLKEAAAIASRPDEKRLILTALSHVDSPKAQEILKTFLQDATLKAEAQLAIQRNLELLKQ